MIMKQLRAPNPSICLPFSYFLNILSITFWLLLYAGFFVGVQQIMASGYQEHQDKRWLKHLEELKSFQKKTGKKYPKPNDGWNSLYNWAKNQRRQYRSGKLPAARKKMLDSVGFPWKTDNKSFEDRIRQLVAYQKKNGTLHVSQVAFKKDSEEHKLSRWVNEMRRLYNENRLSLDRIQRLNKIGFVWNMEDEQFSRNLNRLKKFHATHGHFDVPQTGKTRKLGSWVAQIRSRGLVKKHHIQALNDIGFIWEGKYKRRKKARKTMQEVDIQTYLKKKSKT